MTQPIRNPEHWEYVCRRNAQISAWRRRQADLRRAKERLALVRQEVALRAWEAERAEAREALFEVLDRAERSRSLRQTQADQLALFRRFLLLGGWGCGPSLLKEIGLPRDLFYKRLQRARKLLVRFGASDADLQKWAKGSMKTRPKLLKIRG